MSIKNDFGKIDIEKLEEIIDFLNKRDLEREDRLSEMDELKKRMDKIELGLHKNVEPPFVEEKPKKGKK